MTLALFENVDVDTHNIDNASNMLGVSSATIRNWIKLGYLREVSKGRVCSTSLQDFKKNIIGTDKLMARANKSFADSHDHEALQQKFLDQMESADEDFEVSWISDYETSLSTSYRNKEGVYYTPEEIAADFFNSLPADVSNLVFCDPCCGGGAFLQAAINKGFKPENVYGLDTDAVAVSLTKKRLAKSGFGEIVVRDFLSFIENHGSNIPKPDVIFTNPPWGKKLIKQEKQRIAKLLNLSGNPDTCALFFKASIRFLKDDGYLGMLLPDSFFNVATFEESRREALSQSLIRVKDYGKPFKGLLTKAKGITLQKKNGSATELVDCVTEKNAEHVRQQNEFSTNPKSIINFSCPPSEAEAISAINKYSHITLKGAAKWGLGIVTGNNKKFVRDESDENYIPVYKGSDIHTDKLDSPRCFIPNDFDLYQQTPPRELFLAPEKLVYKFISSKLVFYCDTDQKYFLNSANMIILNSDFPLSSKFMSAYLSSDFVNWYFRVVFETHKVLRGDIESIPIFPQYATSKDIFVEAELLSSIGIERVKNGTYRIKK